MITMTPAQRAQWLNQHNAPTGYMLVTAQEVDQITGQLQKQHELMVAVRAALGPFPAAATGNLAEAADRCFKRYQEQKARADQIEASTRRLVEAIKGSADNTETFPDPTFARTLKELDQLVNPVHGKN